MHYFWVCDFQDLVDLQVVCSRLDLNSDSSLTLLLQVLSQVVESSVTVQTLYTRVCNQLVHRLDMSVKIFFVLVCFQTLCASMRVVNPGCT